MTDLRKAAEMALEFVVLASSKDKAWFTEKEFEVVAALRQALTQPEQEPVAWVECAVIPWLQSKDTNVYAMTKLHRIPNEHYDTPLYTAPPKREWVGLAKDEIHEMIMGMRTKNMGVIMTEEIFRDVEAKLKEKNT